MTPEQIEGNKLIAEFYGFDWTKQTKWVRVEDGKNPHKEIETPLEPEDLLYDSSWDLQIPVWSKVINEIRRIGVVDKRFENEILSKYLELNGQYADAVKDNKPELGFEILLHAIWFYNQAKPTLVKRNQNKQS